MKIILASQSPFRKHALDILGLEYQTVDSRVDERLIQHADPSELAQLLSKSKAMVVAGDYTNAIIIAADLFVVCDTTIIQKPKDEEQAREMLHFFSGKMLEIVTGLAMYNTITKKMLSTTERCKVRFRELSDFEIGDYVKRFPVLQCAGAFEADGLLRFADYIEGNYNFKTAVPMNKLILFLRENGVEV